MHQIYALYNMVITDRKMQPETTFDESERKVQKASS